jgi:outer membrane protein assembly factor BamB
MLATNSRLINSPDDNAVQNQGCAGCKSGWLSKLTVGLSLVASLAHATPLPSRQMPVMFRNDAGHSAAFRDSSTGLYGGILWRAQTSGAVRSSPIVVDNMVLVGSCDGNFYDFDAATGKERWHFSASSAISSSAAVSDGQVFFSDYGGSFYAVSLSDGELVWKTRFGKDLPLSWESDSGPHPDRFNGDFLLSSAAVANDTVVVGAGDGNVYAFVASSGHEKWRFQTGGRVRSSPAIDGHSVYIGSFDGTIYSLDLDSGREVWRYDTEGKKLNSADFGFDRKSILSSPAVVDGNVYIGSRDGFLYALDASKGTLKWRFDHQMSWAISSPAVQNSAVFESSSDGHFFHAVRASDGHELWRFILDGGGWSSPALSATTGYTGDDEGNLFAIDLRSGEERWRFVAMAGIVSSPTIADGMVLFGCNDGAVYAIRVNANTLFKRAVFWDSESARVVTSTTVQSNQTAARNFFSSRGYEIVNSSRLIDWLRARISDHAAGVLVFANDSLPAAIVGTDPSQGLLRAYLNAGGKVAWINEPPLARATLSHGNFDIAWDETDKLLGVSHSGALSMAGATPFAPYDARSTPEGKAWGLEDWWLAEWDVPITAVMTVLATDERGYANAWVKNYGGRDGTGFLFVNRATWSNENFARLAFAAEYLPSAASE